ncbi:MAG: Mov34/MPN/PAD-1 family protein [Candidatus Thorarchaeota archaeon]
MDNIQNQYQNIIKYFPSIKLYNNLISHISIEIKNGIYLEVDYGNFPRKPKVKLINQNGHIYKNLDHVIYSLNTWKSKSPKEIIEVINEIMVFIETFESNTILIKKELLEGILTLCSQHHPREIIGILKMEKNVFNEYIVPPGTYTSRISGVFSPSRLPLAPSYQASVHSHPSGNSLPSNQDRRGVFQGFRCHFIIGFPYTIKNVKCYGRTGKELNFKVVR